MSNFLLLSLVFAFIQFSSVHGQDSPKKLKPKLTAAQEKGLPELFERLDSREWRERDKAEKALKAVGAGLLDHPLLNDAVRSERLNFRMLGENIQGYIRHRQTQLDYYDITMLAERRAKKTREYIEGRAVAMSFFGLMAKADRETVRGLFEKISKCNVEKNTSAATAFESELRIMLLNELKKFGDVDDRSKTGITFVLRDKIGIRREKLGLVYLVVYEAYNRTLVFTPVEKEDNLSVTTLKVKLDELGIDAIRDIPAEEALPKQYNQAYVENISYRISHALALDYESQYCVSNINIRDPATETKPYRRHYKERFMDDEFKDF